MADIEIKMKDGRTSSAEVLIDGVKRKDVRSIKIDLSAQNEALATVQLYVHTLKADFTNTDIVIRNQPAKGSPGGNAAAAKLTPAQRKARAKKGAAARWKNA